MWNFEIIYIEICILNFISNFRNENPFTNKGTTAISVRDVSPGGQRGGVGKGVPGPAEGVVGSICL